MAKKKPEKVNKVLAEGIELGYGFFEQRESRLRTLLLKGVIVYLISMGSIGFYLSAFGIDYNKQLCHVAILIMSLLCAMLYYKLLVENLGYLVLLIGFIGLVAVFRRYINSGFYAIVNITVNDAAEYFQVEIQRLYQEQIEDRYLTVTCLVLFVGFVLDVFLNVYISRRMQYVTVAFVVMSLNLIPLYLVEEPEPLYVVMLMSGMVMAYIFKSGQHYSPQVSIKRNDNGFIEKGKDKKKRKSELFYVSDIKAMLQAGITGILFVLMVALGVNALKPRESFNVGYAGNKYKDITVAAMTTILLDGWQGFFGQSFDVGGMDSGRLGNVSSVRLDYQTDLIVELTPYSYGTVYLKGFVGELYNPYANEWTNIMGTNYDLPGKDWSTYVPESEDESVSDNLPAEYAVRNYNEMLAYKEAYENKQEYSAKSAMNIWIMDYAVRQGCKPYYTESSGYIGAGGGYHRGRSYKYYPSFGTSAVYTNPEYTDLDLYVPEENIPAIEETIAAAGAAGSDEQIIEAIIEYYQENIPYTIRPGRTPRNADFINYFLQDNKKGYCAHYASAAVLMFRYMGIPARYVEGYAIDYSQMANGDLVENAEYADYYDGYSEIGETALIRVNVTDADAHAWVEVYTSTKGWHVVDVTPSGETEEVEDFWTLFEEYMDDSDAADDDGNNLNLNNMRIPTKVLRAIFFGFAGIMGAFILVVAGKKGIKEISLYIKYAKAGINDKLIYKYVKFRRRLARKNQQLGNLINYREQITYIVKTMEKTSEIQAALETESEQVIDILERAGFGANEISEADYNQAVHFFQAVAR
ncbi:MAG: transglutaminase-like domain-containing protein [Clostridium sp.]|nr:transglutaminase-like domain-containing protein [Clostridium sp.]MCM1398522.1 transglutaminase-like domain-containing protein [Clostridium sp.]MCM1460244.1 transglutaminase-like domain-containing protein [Bacteroides sp.]